MKKIIIIVGTIILGVYIVTTLINGDTNSFKSGANGVVTKSLTEIETITN